ncbi:CO(2)-response secreted protease-like [Salvia miltiorrhiza]|uniref:CO(2)-response secreted protease-like n=1 Tax=Salvia miltiorrhiza TaxID=226208 RepID=UPI0025AC6888|nr:CO(2)-response secreted protease-like [Salvia miltiorrhiza]
MRLYSFCFGVALFWAASFLLVESSDAQRNNGVYIVYMGASPPTPHHSQILTSLLTRKRKSVIQTYSNGFSGFAARLTEQEAKSIAEREGVISVFPDPLLQLHTTRSWDFLKYQTDLKIDSAPTSSSSPGDDTIVGILDTGIWPESESFIDTEMGPIPSRWKGKCMEGQNFTSSNCNKKIIGARYYGDDDEDEESGTSPSGTPRDASGHGTHVSSTVAGMAVSGASYYGLAAGNAAGGSPRSRIAMYRVCLASGGCLGSAILKAFDDAVADGVDVLSLSLGGSPGAPDFDTDPIAIGAFHAVEKGIVVVCSAGNSGPYSSSVVNVAPWILTVAATTIDRDFEARILLGGNKIIKGGGINFSSLNKTSVYPLTDGLSAKSASTSFSEDDARNCIPGSLEEAKVKGKIVLCENGDKEYLVKEKFSSIRGAVGMIVADNDLRQVASKYGVSPISAVTKADGAQILSYINSTSNPVATILPTEVIPDYKPAPVVGYFSSRGPAFGIRNLIKPDIAAPGVSILAAWPSHDTREALPGKDPPVFDILSGTSMACPHVSGLAANVKSQHPTWTESAIRSAIMTTAIQTNNLHAPITTNDGSIATPYDIGAGEISVAGPLQPGLVYETESIDYLLFLCNMGYDTAVIKRIASSLPSNFSCSGSAKADSISNMNYPSIAISDLTANANKTVTRRVTNVGEEDSTYSCVVEAPASLDVQVVPDKLQFTKSVNKLSFQVTFKMAANSKEDLFGSITWSNEKYKVRSPFVVSNKS